MQAIQVLNLRAWLTVLRSRHAAYYELLKVLRRDEEAKRKELSAFEEDLVGKASGDGAPAFLRNMRY